MGATGSVVIDGICFARAILLEMFTGNRNLIKSGSSLPFLLVTLLRLCPFVLTLPSMELKSDEGGIGSVGNSVRCNVLKVLCSFVLSITVVGVKAVMSAESSVVVGEVERVLLNFLCETKVESVVGGTFIGEGVFRVWSVSAAEKRRRSNWLSTFANHEFA